MMKEKYIKPDSDIQKFAAVDVIDVVCRMAVGA